MLSLLRPQELSLLVDGVVYDRRKWEQMNYGMMDYYGLLDIWNLRILDQELWYTTYAEGTPTKTMWAKTTKHRIELPDTYPVMMVECPGGVVVCGANQREWFITGYGVIQYQLNTSALHRYQLPSYSQLMEGHFNPSGYVKYTSWLWSWRDYLISLIF